MKLLFCMACQDLFKLRQHRFKSCQCGKSKGKYLDELNAIYKGEYAVPIGIDNMSFCKSLQKLAGSQKEIGSDFKAFTINKFCKTYVRK